MIILLSKKGYTILFILVFAFTAAVFYFGFKYEKKYFTLIVDPNLKVKYDGKNWIIITDNITIMAISENMVFLILKIIIVGLYMIKI